RLWRPGYRLWRGWRRRAGSRARQHGQPDCGWRLQRESERRIRSRAAAARCAGGRYSGVATAPVAGPLTGRPANPFFRDPLFWLALIAIGLVTPALALLPGIVLAPSWPGTPAFVLFVVVYPVLEEVVFRAGLHYG